MIRAECTWVLRGLGTFGLVLLLLTGCGTSGEDSDQAGADFSRVTLQMDFADPSIAASALRAASSPQLRQAELITEVVVGVTGEGIDDIVVECPRFGPSTSECQVTETANAIVFVVTLRVPTGSNRTITVTALASGVPIFEGATTATLTQAEEVVRLVLELVRNAVQSEDLAGKTFVFPDGAAFGLPGSEVTLQFLSFVGDTGFFVLQSGEFVASGEITLGSCLLLILESTFLLAGLQIGDQLLLDPCDVDFLERLLVENLQLLMTSISNPATVNNGSLPSFSAITVTPNPARSGVLSTITFTASETLQANPTVTVSGQSATFASASGLDFTYTYTVQGTEPEGAAAVEINGVDLAGNAGSNTGVVTLDFTAPSFSAITALPDPAGTGTTLSITFTASETLQANPTVTVDGSLANFDNVIGSTYTFTFVVQGTEPQGLVTIDVSGADLAGNIGANQGSVTLELTAPIVAITFPGPSLLTYTDVTTRGTAQDTNSIASVTVNGNLAATTDNFDNWDTIVTLPAGPGDLTVSTEDALGNTDASAATAMVFVGAFLSDPNGIAIEGNGQLVVVDSDLDAVVRVDPTTGDRTIVSDAVTGAGPAFSFLQGIAVEASGQLVVVDDGLNAVVRVDPTTGDRTIVSDAATGAGPAFGFPRGIAVEASGQLVVVDRDLDAVVRVDPSTGDRTIVSDAATGAGPNFTAPRGIAVEASGQLVVVDGSLDAVVRVDPPTGDRTIVSDDATGAGPAFSFPLDIAVEASGQLVVVDGGLDAVVRVDPSTGNRTIVSNTTIGKGQLIIGDGCIAIEASGQLIVAEDTDVAIMRFDAITGDRAILSISADAFDLGGGE